MELYFMFRSGFLTNSSKDARAAGDKVLQEKIVDECLSLGESIFTSAHPYSCYFHKAADSDFAIYFQIASEVAEDIGDREIKKRISQLCFSIINSYKNILGVYTPYYLSYAADFYMMVLMNDLAQSAQCLDGILYIYSLAKDQSCNGYDGKELPLWLDDKERILWLAAGISLLVDPAGSKTSYSERILEKREELTVLLPALQNEIIKSNILPSEILSLIMGFLQYKNALDMARDYAPVVKRQII